MPVADLLELSSEESLAENLGETVETISRWRAAGAVPEAKVPELIRWALLGGHREEASRVASQAAPLYADAIGLLDDLGKQHDAYQRALRTDGATVSAQSESEHPLTRITEEMREHRVFTGDAVARVRALRVEWDWRDELLDRIRSGEHD